MTLRRYRRPEFELELLDEFELELLDELELELLEELKLELLEEFELELLDELELELLDEFELELPDEFELELLDELELPRPADPPSPFRASTIGASAVGTGGARRNTSPTAGPEAVAIRSTVGAGAGAAVAPPTVPATMRVVRLSVYFIRVLPMRPGRA